MSFAARLARRPSADGDRALVVRAPRRYRRRRPRPPPRQGTHAAQDIFALGRAQDLVHALGPHKITITQLATSVEFPLILKLNEAISSANLAEFF